MRARQILLTLLGTAALTACGPPEPSIEIIDHIPVDELTTTGGNEIAENNLVLTVSSQGSTSMAHQVADHARKALGVPDRKSPNVQWLRIYGHYVIESVYAGACHLVVDVSAPSPIDIWVHQEDQDTGKAANTLCPAARRVALDLLRHRPFG
ncbi:hypothetical protein [Actinophytocola gossypii]|uniref:Lipoprotein n=1 Tax=Actinophytocola gossypii TaxID=2812003 RepID=A0ABT2JKJ5_9PSEU|nr:hypothetical protein [Actinophytocola gossypii]MCT2587829.1 hypothetical protein [Actinophytocola gossypii]